jgi:nucleoside-diphosphate-sugar epimerase
LSNLFFGFPKRDLQAIYDSCESIWPKLEESDILIMGGTGFIGKWLVASLGYAQLAGHSINITVLSRNPNKYWESFSTEGSLISWMQGDVAKAIDLDIEKFQYIINGATPSSAQNGAIFPKYVYDSIVLGNKSVLKASTKQNFRYIFLSSGAVTQLESTEKVFIRKICEAEHLDTLSTAYSHGKRFAEIDIEESRLSSGLNAQALRLYAFAGPGLPLDQHFAAGNFMNDFLNKGSIEIMGNPNTLRSYMYPTDLVKHIFSCTVTNENETREVGSTEIVSLYKLAELISRDQKAIIETQGALNRPASVYFPDSKDILGQTISLDESIIRWKEWLGSIKS